MRLLVLLWASLGLCHFARAQIETEKLIPPDSSGGDRFGYSLGSSGNWLIVGKPEDDAVADQSGAAYLFARMGNQWGAPQKLKAADPEFGDIFGFSVSLDGSQCVIGAKSEDPASIFAAGSCYVFEEQGGVWLQTAKLWASDAQPNTFFGWSVDISGDRLIAGAREDFQGGFTAGAAYVFDRVGGVWQQSAKLVASDATASSFFGEAVSLWGDLAIAGAPGSGGRGAAYVFQRFGSAWTEVGKLVASDGAAQDSFGTAVAIGQDIALVGATNHDHGVTNSGAVYAFERVNGVWVQTQEIHTHDRMIGALFGIRLSLCGVSAFAGAVGDGAAIGDNRGAAYLLARTPLGWVEIGKALARDGSYGDGFGTVSLDGSTPVIGAAFVDDACPSSLTCNSGAAYDFEIAPEARQYGHCTSGAPCGNVSPHGGCVNSTGVGATLAAAGLSSVSLDELRVEARNMQPARSAFVFMGAGQGQSILGDGLRTVTSGNVGFFRYPLRQTGIDGSFIEGPGLVALAQQRFPPQAQLLAGSTWNFQCWYRDSGGPCGQGTNLSNSVEVAFMP